MAEQLPCKQQVAGSSPAVGSQVIGDLSLRLKIANDRAHDSDAGEIVTYLIGRCLYQLRRHARNTRIIQMLEAGTHQLGSPLIRKDGAVLVEPVCRLPLRRQPHQPCVYPLSRALPVSQPP